MRFVSSKSYDMQVGLQECASLYHYPKYKSPHTTPSPLHIILPMAVHPILEFKRIVDSLPPIPSARCR